MTYSPMARSSLNSTSPVVIELVLAIGTDAAAVSETATALAGDFK